MVGTVISSLNPLAVLQTQLNAIKPSSWNILFSVERQLYIKDQVPLSFLWEFMKVYLMHYYANMNTTKTNSSTSLEAGEEIQHYLLEFGIGCLRDFAVSPAIEKQIGYKTHDDRAEEKENDILLSRSF